MRQLVSPPATPAGVVTVATERRSRSGVPGVKKAVKWNSPFYGKIENAWFLSFHVFTRYVKVAFFNGASLKPPPPGTSKQARVRYYDIYEGAFDEKQFTAWVKQTTKFPGEKM
jgi:hypothetical protein